jgi:hypothetical protein
MRIEAIAEDWDTQPDTVERLDAMLTSASGYDRARVYGIVIAAGVSPAVAARLLHGIVAFTAPSVRHMADFSSLIAIADLFGGFAALDTIELCAHVQPS